MVCEASSVDGLSVGAFESMVATLDPWQERQAAHYRFHSATIFLSSRGTPLDKKVVDLANRRRIAEKPKRNKKCVKYISLVKRPKKKIPDCVELSMSLPPAPPEEGTFPRFKSRKC